MTDAHFTSRKNGIEKDKARMDKWNEPPIPDRMTLLRDLTKTVNHVLIYLEEINQTLDDDDGLLDILEENYHNLDERLKKLEQSSETLRKIEQAIGQT